MNQSTSVQTRFHVIKKSTGEVLPVKYEAGPMFYFHTINAYEEGGAIVVDIAAFDDATIINRLFLENLKKTDEEPRTQGDFPPVRRYTLPLVKIQSVRGTHYKVVCTYITNIKNIHFKEYNHDTYNLNF